MVSIIIPIYNTEQYLRQALDSIINQTYKNLQIICINDGSTDNSLSIIEEYARKDNRIEIISQDNKGLSAVRNVGMQHSKGEYLTFVDSDDWIDLDCIEKAVTYAKNSQAQVVMWSYIKESLQASSKVHFWNNNRTFEKEQLQNLHIRLLGLIGKELRQIETLDSLGTVCMKLYKTSLIKETALTFTDTKSVGSGEDVLANQYLFNFVHKVAYINDTFYHYRRNPISLTNTYREHLVKQWQVLFAKMRENYMKHPLQNLVVEAFHNRIALSIVPLCLNIVSSTLSVREQYKKTKEILAADWYKQAINKLLLKHLKIHWKIYFIAAKYKLTSIVLLLSKTIQIIRKG